jgi:hypothetical protein
MLILRSLKSVVASQEPLDIEISGLLAFRYFCGQPLDLGFGKGVDMNGLHCIVLGSQDAGSENKVWSFS